MSKIIHAWIRVSVGTAALASAIPALAQEEPATGEPSPSAVGISEPGMGDIVVTAQRRSQRLVDVPISITAQTGDQLTRAGVVSTRDLPQVVPGLVFTAQGAWVEPNIRGVHTTLSGPGSDSPIAVYVDGFYQPNQVGNAFDLPDVSRVEVLKGPQGTLFGRNATGGAISVHTIDPGFDWSGSFSVSDSIYVGKNVKTANEISVKGQVGGPITEDSLAFSASGFYSTMPGFLTNDVTGGRTGKIESYMLRGKLLWQPSYNVSFILGANYSHKVDHYGSAGFPIDGLTSASLYPDAIIPQKPWHVASEMHGGQGSTINVETWGVNLTSDFTFENIGTLTSRTGYSHTDVHVDVDVDAAYSPSCLAANGCINFISDYGPQKTFQQELSLASEQFGAFSFTLGGLFYDDSHFFHSNVNPPLGAFGTPDYNTFGIFGSNVRVKTRAYAGFGEANFAVTDRLHLIGGLRYSWERKRGMGAIFDAPLAPIPGGTFDSWTPRLSVRYDLSDNANVYATYSKGFKSGVIDYSGFQEPAHPETIDSFEVGVKIFEQDYSINFSAFYYDYKDLQVQFFDGIISTSGNAANARIYGFDFDSTARVASDFTIRVAGSWLPHAKFRDFPSGIDYVFPLTPFGLTQTVVDAGGMRLLKTPKLTGNVSVNYAHEYDVGLVEAQIGVYHSSSYKWNLLGRFRTGAHTTLNSQLSITPHSIPVTLTLWGKNLTNKSYVTAGLTGANADVGVFAPPRQIGVRAEYKF